MTRLAELQRFMQRVVALPDVDELAFPESLDPRDAATLANADPRHVTVYRRLIRGTLKGSLKLQFPLTAARLSEHHPRDVELFCEQELPRSQVLRDVAFEFVAWATPRWRDDEQIADFLVDLARYELLEFDVYCARRRVPQQAAEPCADELDAGLGVYFDSSARLGHFDYAVHELPDDEQDRSEPRREVVALLGYRDGENAFQRMELSALAAAIIERLWLDGEPLGSAVKAACDDLEQSLDQSVIDGIATVLADLAERGVVLGARPPGPTAERSPWTRWLVRGAAGMRPFVASTAAEPSLSRSGPNSRSGPK